MCFAGVKQLPRFLLFPRKKGKKGEEGMMGEVQGKAWCIPPYEPRPVTLCYTFGYLQREKRGKKKVERFVCLRAVCIPRYQKPDHDGQ